MRATASKALLLSHCQAWARDGAIWSVSGSDAADFGTTHHAAAYALISLGSMSQLDTDAWRHLSAWVVKNRRVGWRGEIAWAWDPVADTARELGENIGREYEKHGATPGDLCGSADIVCMDGDCVVVYDIKTGHDISGVWTQMGALCLLAARATGVTRARAIVVHATEEGVQEHERELDAFDLDAIAGSLADDIAKIESSEPKPGDHCSSMYCPARVTCTATQKAASQVLPTDALARNYKLGTNIQGPEHASWMLHRVELLLDMGEQIREALKGYARANGGIPVEGGKVWAEVPSVRQSVDGKAALALAEKAGADPLDLANCMRSATVNSFRKVRAKGRAA